MKSKQVVAVFLAILLAVIIVQNSSVAVVQLLFWKISMSMIVLIFLSALVGFAIGWLIGHHADGKKTER